MHEAVTVECVVLLIPCLCVVDNTLNYITVQLHEVCCI